MAFPSGTTNTVVGDPITVGELLPLGLAINPAGTRVYVANGGSGSVSVIDTATLAVTSPGQVPDRISATTITFLAARLRCDLPDLLDAISSR